MNCGKILGLQSEIIEDLTLELKNDPSFDADILKVKVKNAIRDVRSRRCYGATFYSEDEIAEDLESYYSVIKNVALYDYNQSGAEGQVVHDENSISRTWVERDKLFNGVVAFVKIL